MKIGPNRPKDIFVGQNNGTNNGKSTKTANTFELYEIFCFSDFGLKSQKHGP
jgi:hypothetical protein